ncbi:MAG TPA: hypothetical protein VLM81_02440 [Peptostreptococcaceae bacterium]|nr:hypothetical protein [Peptostreptococcaceae bacterium]
MKDKIFLFLIGLFGYEIDESTSSTSTSSDSYTEEFGFGFE